MKTTSMQSQTQLRETCWRMVRQNLQSFPPSSHGVTSVTSQRSLTARRSLPPPPARAGGDLLQDALHLLPDRAAHPHRGPQLLAVQRQGRGPLAGLQHHGHLQLPPQRQARAPGAAHPGTGSEPHCKPITGLRKRLAKTHLCRVHLDSAA